MTTGEAGHRALVLRAYAAYNAQDAEVLLALVGDDVDWPDDDGGRLHGKDALRAYWAEQWTRTRTHDEPVAVAEQDDGRVAVRVEQVVRSLDGEVRSAGRVEHLLRIDGGRITRLDIVAGPDAMPGHPVRRA